jgi:hypothetical protein
MTKTTKRKATVAGAKTEEDFALFVTLVSLRDSVRKQLSPMTRAMLASYDLVLKRGRFYQTQPFPKGYRRGKAQDCYGNSSKLAMFKEGLTYCEGAVLCQFGTLVSHVDHAWCVTDDGKVIDVTLKNAGLSYFGVPLTLEELATITGFPALDEIVDVS